MEKIKCVPMCPKKNGSNLQLNRRVTIVGGVELSGRGHQFITCLLVEAKFELELVQEEPHLSHTTACLPARVRGYTWGELISMWVDSFHNSAHDVKKFMMFFFTS
jgi:hypothetical protein